MFKRKINREFNLSKWEYLAFSYKVNLKSLSKQNKWYNIPNCYIDYYIEVTTIEFIYLIIIAIGLILLKKVTSSRLGNLRNRSIQAKIIAKRSYFTKYKLLDDRDYYITFETEDKKRMEFFVDSSTYGLLVKGDVGTLIYQEDMFRGPRYKNFVLNHEAKKVK